MKLDFRDRVVIVTGATLPRGIGKGIALKFAEERARLVLVGRDRARGKKTLEEVLGKGAEGIFVSADVGDESDVQELVQNALDAFGRIDIVINNAADQTKKRILNLSTEEFERSLKTNVLGVFHTIRCVAPRMMRNGGGSIINISSTGGIRGGAYAAGAAYCSSKAAQIQLTRVAALDLGRYNIRINCIVPGGIASPEVEDPKYGKTGALEEFYGQRALAAPLGRCGIPEDIASACMYLASEQARYITGAVLYVEGGMMAGRYPGPIDPEASSYPPPPSAEAFPKTTLFSYED
jgi:NAD(P)-dependent dehydrogenase (short-subunit alcohol dehydrogenase family)